MQHDIAVVGMVCRVPGANDVDAFWEMLISGKEGLRTLTSVELEKLPVPASPPYVPAGGYIDGVDLFDADLFGFTARDATLMDPQHRLWLQACWQALEVTGHAGLEHRHIGVFASMGPNGYLKQLLLQQDNPEQQQAALLGNVPDCLATRVAYTFNLTGPSMTIQCGCSSSLVGLHQARLALLAKQCDAALVGGICISVPPYQGYTHVEGGFASPDGHCRPFSHDAAGTVFSSGYGVVVVKRLADALAAGDMIYAVIKGSAINNDGADKASFTAPSVHGQATVIAKALRVAGLTANDIQYVETHGTATPIGDPIELAALAQAFQQSSPEYKQIHTLGSVKANVGHLDVAAGIVSFIKTCLMLHHAKLPPQIHFQTWNKKYAHAEQLFRINQTVTPWQTSDKRRAGVSAFGFGGTNAHVIVEAAPERVLTPSSVSALNKLIVLSAKSSKRLMLWIQDLRTYLQKQSDVSLAELAYTLQVGRSQQSVRFLVTVNSIAELISVLGRVTAVDFVHCNGKSSVLDIKDKPLAALHQAWLSGHRLNWQVAYAETKLKKMLLPAAPLQLEAYWIESSIPKKTSPMLVQTDLKKVLYQTIWRQLIPSDSLDLATLQPIMLVSAAQDKLTAALIHYFAEQNLRYYWVTTGAAAKRINARHWQINMEAAYPFQALEQEWQANQQLPLTCLLSMEIIDVNSTSAYPTNVLISLAQQNQLIRHCKQLSALVMGMSAWVQQDKQPLGALLIGLLRGIGQEFPHLKTQLIDLENAATNTQCQAALTVMRSSELNDICVWRNQLYWQQEYQLRPEANAATPYFKQHGVYLVTGGLGDVASVHVDFLGKEYQAQLILLGRSTLPDEQMWSTLLASPETDKKLQAKLARLLAWQAAGIQVYPRTGDITDIEQMRLVCQQVIAEWGAIDGIIHCAGAGSDMHYKVLTELSWAHCWELFKPKLMGIHTIATLAAEYQIKDCLIISSISSALTGIGLSAYGASHNLLDAMVQTHHPHWRSMNWDAWNFYQHHETKKQGELGAEIDKVAIKPAQGYEILRHAFNLPAWQQLFVSLADLPARHRYWAQRGFLAKINTSSAKHPRPSLHTEYVAPSTPLQQRLAASWQTLLGIDKVGIHDNFFELGGHSLLALELVHCLQTEFKHACSVVELFEAPTVAQLAQKMVPLEMLNQQAVTNVNDRVSKQLAARRAIHAVRETTHVQK